ncbi:FAD-dependent thymidylate synthase [bacterium]|nr:FAD-dependent thymidylate synthase [bacterium]
MKVELLSITPEPEKHIELCGRTCYQSYSKITEDSSSRFIRMILENEHESVLEHASATFRISGISRAMTHQLVRHRLASYSQKSQRYCKEEQFEYVMPPSIEKHKNKLPKAIYKNIIEDMQYAYRHLIDCGVPKEDARFILPNACTTEIVMTANFRNWRHIIKMRCSKHAQWEIRDVMCEVLKVLYSKAPSVFRDLFNLYIGN